MSLSTWPHVRSSDSLFARRATPDAVRAAPAETAGAPRARRYDLDWIRVAAFGLLILYHVSLVYAPYDWHIRSTHTFSWLREGLLLTNPWRLTLLFLVSGAALRFMSRSKTAALVAKARLERLGPPLLFGVLALVPIQSWIEAMDKGSWSGGLLSWMAHEFGPAGLADGVPVNHLWFLVFIAAYSLAALPLIASATIRARLESRLEGVLAGWRVLVLPAAYLAAIRLVLFPIFPLTNQLHSDWYNHALSFGAFVFGFLVVGRESVWRDLERFRWISFATACVAVPLVMIQAVHPGGGAFHGVPRNIVFAIDQWAVIAAVLGFGSRHLRSRCNPALAYLNEAIFPCYLAHQTVLVLAVWMIKPVGLPSPIEALLLIGVTFAGSLLIYETVRRVPAIRPLWGLKPMLAGDAVARPFARRRLLLGFGMGAPLLALASVLLAIAAYPDFNQARQYLSELGGAASRAPIIFNAGVLCAGLMAGLAGLGFGLAIAGLTRARFVAGLTAVVFVVAGAGLATAAIYPWPDPRHLAVNLGLGIQLAPLLLLWGLKPRRDLRGLKLFLASVFVAMAVLTVLTKHLLFPGLVNDANVGLWERAYALVLVGWVGIAAFVLDRRLKMEAPEAPGPN